MNVKVYFESSVCAFLVAVFEDEETYAACTPALEKLARKKGMIVTESIGEYEIIEKD
jgi:DNA-binding phage protein